MEAMTRRRPRRLRRVLALGAAAAVAVGVAVAWGLDLPAAVRESHTSVPAGDRHYAPSPRPDRIVATPAADASQAFAVSWRTAPGIDAPLLEVVEAGEGPDFGTPRRVRAATVAFDGGNGPGLQHQARVDGLRPGALHAFRVQGAGGWWSPWRQLRTPRAEAPFTFLYFGDTQSRNAALSTRVVLAAVRQAPDAALALFAGDLVNGRDGEDDDEWGEWFEAVDAAAASMLLAPAIGNHEYGRPAGLLPVGRPVPGGHWPVAFALPGNGVAGAAGSYWFDAGPVRFAVLDGTSALKLGTARAQAAWLDAVLAEHPRPWSVVLVHQPFYSPRKVRDNDALREALQPVLERHGVDLVLQGHDHAYGRRGGADPARATPQYIVSVAGAKQYPVSGAARASMAPVAEGVQLFQVVRIDAAGLHYEARTATGRLLDAFRLEGGRGAARRLVERGPEGAGAPAHEPAAGKDPAPRP